ncbi:MAG: hypothetical protein IT456_13310 [Planctomycetes bacterium]|nr:hypothetical protein [Planctomycetota bacterium]
MRQASSLFQTVDPRAAIHAIGIGEVDSRLLERIAADGRGVCIKIGK